MELETQLLKQILLEIKTTNMLLTKLVKTNLKESKENAKEARMHRKQMLTEAKKLLETPNREAMILEELRKRGHNI